MRRRRLANALVAAVRDRMPVVLSEAAWDDRLDVEGVEAERAAALCGPCAEGELVAIEVGSDLAER
ncbi:MAG: SOS response-associated peptidase family protein [Polyangiaceae bacterium]